MADRSYLYSSNCIPRVDADQSKRKIYGIAEYSYDIPYIYKLLLAGNTKTCRSAIWNQQDDIALIGDFDQGLTYLRTFLSQLRSPIAERFVVETKTFFANQKLHQPYFLLECGEIFQLNSSDFAGQNRALRDEILEAPTLILRVAKELNDKLNTPLPKPSFMKRILGKVPTEREILNTQSQPIYEVGLGGWSEILYFDFINEGESDLEESQNA